LTNGPPALNLFASAFNQQWHVTYADRGGTLWDSWYDGPSNRWNLQQINFAGGVTTGLPGFTFAAVAPFASVLNQQWHVTWTDGGPPGHGIIIDAWYDGSNNTWYLQQINAGGLTNGPPTVSNPFATVFKQGWHVTYQDGLAQSGIITLTPLWSL